MNKAYIKSADISPKAVYAGDSVEISVRLVAGCDFSAQGSRIILDFPVYLGASRPSRHHGEDSGFITVFCSNPDINYMERMWDMEIMDFPTRQKTSFRGMAQRLFVIDFTWGNASEDDEIIIKWGYIRNGFGAGTKVATVVLEKEFYNTIDVRYFEDGSKALPDYGRSFKGYKRPEPDQEILLRYRILPREPESIRIIPKQYATNIHILDRFFNLCHVERLGDVIEEKVVTVENSHGVHVVNSPNVVLTSKVLPVRQAPDMTNVFEVNNIYFGDLHTHSSISNDCIEREKMQMTPEKMFCFGREAAGLDFMAITDHHQPWDAERNKIGERNWERICRAAKENDIPGEFAAFTGMEFRCERGDTAVIFNEYFPYAMLDNTEIRNIKDLWHLFQGKDYITIPHFHNLGRLPEGEWYTCPYTEVETLLEIFSCHDSYESDCVLERRIAESKSLRKDRVGRYFLQQGYRYGFTCNSDGHKGNPGCNGLTAVYAQNLTRDSIMEAIRKRHVYGTTNARIRLLFIVNGGLMGSVLENKAKKEFYISIAGECPFKAVDVFRDGVLAKRYKPNSINFEDHFTLYSDYGTNWYVRATQMDNHIAYSSPVWFQ